MNKIILTILALILCASPAHATITRAQYFHVYVGTSGAFSVANTAGSLIVVTVSGSDGGASSVSDTKGNTYSFAGEMQYARTMASIYYTYNVAAGANTITAQSGNNDIGFTAIEYTSSNGSFTSDPLDGTGGFTDTGVTFNPITKTLTTTGNGVLIGFWADEQGYTFSSWTSNLTEIQNDGGHYDAVAEGLNKAAGTYTEGINSTGASGSGVIALYAFKEPAGGGAPTGGLTVQGGMVIQGGVTVKAN